MPPATAFGPGPSLGTDPGSRVPMLLPRRAGSKLVLPAIHLSLPAAHAAVRRACWASPPTTATVPMLQYAMSAGLTGAGPATLTEHTPEGEIPIDLPAVTAPCATMIDHVLACLADRQETSSNWPAPFRNWNSPWTAGPDPASGPGRQRNSAAAGPGFALATAHAEWPDGSWIARQRLPRDRRHAQVSGSLRRRHSLRTGRDPVPLNARALGGNRLAADDALNRNGSEES